MLARFAQSRALQFPGRLLLTLVAGLAALFFLHVAASLAPSLELQPAEPAAGSVAETSSTEAVTYVADSASPVYVESIWPSQGGLVAEGSSVSESGTATEASPEVLAAEESLEEQVAVVPAAPAEAGASVQLLDSGTWDLVPLGNVQQALASLPASVRAELGNPALGIIKISVNTDGVTSVGSQPYGGAANFFTTNDGLNEVVLYPRQPVLTILHEFGHAFNLRYAPAGDYASVLLGDEMQSFMAMAGWQVLTPASQVGALIDHSRVEYAYDGEAVWSGLSKNDPLEDFANSFALYFGDPVGLLELSPERYQWFAERF